MDNRQLMVGRSTPQQRPQRQGLHQLLTEYQFAIVAARKTIIGEDVIANSQYSTIAATLINMRL